MLPTCDQVYEGPKKLWMELDKDYRLSEKGQRRKSTGDDVLDMKVATYRPFYSFHNSPGITNAELSNEFPITYNAYAHWKDKSPSSFRWIIEALMMTENNNNKQIAEDIGPPMKPAIIKAYRELYFDVKDNLNRPPWINKYIWAPTRGCKSEEMFFVTNVYKRIALYGGKHAFMAIMSGEILKQEVIDILYDIVSSDESISSLKSPANYAKLDAVGRSVHHSNIINRVHKDRVLKSGGGGMPAIPVEVMRSLGSAVGGSMRVMGLEMQLDSKEVVQTDMYTDEDIKNANNGKNG